MYFRYIVYISPWKTVWPFIWTDLNPLHPRIFFAKFGCNLPIGSKENEILKYVNLFWLFQNFSPWKRTLAFHWTNSNPLYPRILCAKFGWNCRTGSGEDDFSNLSNVFSLFRNYLPFKEDRALHLNKHFPLHPRMLCAKFGWNWSNGSGEKDFWISSMYFCYFVIISPCKGMALHFKKLESPSPRDALWQVWLKLAQWFWRRRWKCDKFMTKTTPTATDNGQIVIRKSHVN